MVKEMYNIWITMHAAAGFGGSVSVPCRNAPVCR
jgi:hypothetical protein